MGIYLALYAVSDATIARLEADPILAWRIVDPERPEREAEARAESMPRPGLFARVFKGAKPEPPPEPPPLQLAPGEGELGPDGDFEKSWHGLHYLLTGEADGGEPPLAFLMSGGREIDMIDGETPLLAYTHAETRRIAEALGGLSDEEVKARVDPEKMTRLDLYPGGWKNPQSIGFLLDEMKRLRKTLAEIAGRGFGVLVSIG